MEKKPDKEKIIEVLTYLQNYCELGGRNCVGCVFTCDYYNGCMLNHYPEYWDVDNIVGSLFYREVKI